MTAAPAPLRPGPPRWRPVVAPSRGAFVALAALAAALVAPPALAQAPVKRKPGLWEVQLTEQRGHVAGQAMPSPQQMEAMRAQMPKAQREQMDKLMRERGMGMTDKANTVRHCLSPEAAERGPLVEPPDAGMQCEHRMTPVTARELRFSFTCAGPKGRMQGEGRAWDLSPEHYKTSMTMEGSINGQPMSMSMTQTGRWLGSDCQGIKPAGK